MSTSLVPLNSEIYQDSRWCSHCGGPQTFVPVVEFFFTETGDGGREGYCLGCGEWKVEKFSRVTMEAA